MAKPTAIPSMSKELTKALKLIIALEGVFSREELQQIIDAPVDDRLKLAVEWRKVRANIPVELRALEVPEEPKLVQLDYILRDVFGLDGEDPSEFEPQLECLAREGQLRSICERLSDRERVMFIMRSGLDGNGRRMTRQIADAFGLSRSRVEQILSRVGAIIRREFDNHQREQKLQQRTPSTLSFEDPIEDLDLSERARWCLRRGRITTVGELVEKSEDELLSLVNFGHSSLKEVKTKLAELGLHLKGEIL